MPTSHTNEGTNSCWPWQHKWTKWGNDVQLTKNWPSNGSIIDYGVQQERRCQRCNKIELRVEWSRK